MRVSLKIAFLLCAIGATLTQADTTWVSDTVSGVWDSTGSPYILTANCYVDNGETLIIGPGVEVLSAGGIDRRIFNRWFSYTHVGFFVIEGSLSKPVTIRNVGIEYPTQISYAIIESVDMGVLNPLSIDHSEIRYCRVGIGNLIEGSFLNIHHCYRGIGNQENASIIRSLFHHNTYGIQCAPWGDFRLYFNCEYCTFSNNDSASAYLDMYEDYVYTEWNFSQGSFYNCIICDTIIEVELPAIISQSYYSFSFISLSLDPMFNDTASFDYTLQEYSPYIDLGIGPVPPDSFVGFAPDLGAFESPYTRRPPVLSPTGFSEVYYLSSFSDTFNVVVKLVNFGSTVATEVSASIDFPHFIVSISDSIIEPAETCFINLVLSPFDCGDIKDTLYIQYDWLEGHLVRTSEFPIPFEIRIVLDGVVSDSLTKECSPYYVNRVVIPADEELVIYPGSSFFKRTDGIFNVLGSVRSSGSLEDSISFNQITISLKDSLDDRRDTSFFNYCNFDNSGIQTSRTTIFVNNTLFQNTSKATIIRDTSIANFIECKMMYCLGDWPEGEIRNSVVSFEDCDFLHNSARVYSVYDSYTHDYWPLAYAFLMRIYSSNVIFKKCLFKDNYVNRCPWWDLPYYRNQFLGEAFGAWNSDILIENTIFDEDDPYTSGGSIVFNNSTIIQSGGYRIEAGPGIYIYAMYLGSFYESAFNSIFKGSSFALPGSSVKNSVVQRNEFAVIGDSSSILWGTPTFADSSYSLLPTSLGIDMGASFAVTDSGDTIWAPTTDYYGNPRPSGTEIDIGAVEYQWDTYEPSISGSLGWNLISAPYLYPHNISEILTSFEPPVYGYNPFTRVYVLDTIMAPGKAYWAMVTDTFTLSFGDSALDSIALNLHAGWNLIGAIGAPVSANVFDSYPEIIFPIYGYDALGGSYFASPVILPGRGYWVLSTGDVSVVLRR